MRTKKSFLFAMLITALVTAVALSCVFMTACGGEEEDETPTYAITWTIPTDPAGIKVTAEGYTTLPEAVAKGTVITFTVEGPAGYDITVSGATAKNGKYELTVNSKKTVTVKAEKTVTSITAALKDPSVKKYEDDKFEASEIDVTATYADTTTGKITSGFTIVYQPDAEGNATEALSKGDTYITISYKGKEMQIDFDAVEERFGFTEVDVEVGDDGKPYYVLKGTYAQADVENFKHVGFDFQVQGNYSTNGWAYTNYNIDMPEDNLVDGIFTLRVDMTELSKLLAQNNVPSMLFNPHMGFNPPGDNSGNKNVETENYEEGKTITVDDISYKLHREKEENDAANTTWGMVGVIVSDANYKPTVAYAKDDITVETVALEDNEGTAVLKVTGTVKNYVEDTEDSDTLHVIYFATVNNGSFEGNPVSGWDTTVRTSHDNVTYVAGEEGTATFTLTFNLDELTGTACWFHFGADSNDLPFSKVVEGKESVTVGDKTYTLFAQTDPEQSPELNITAAATDDNDNENENQGSDNGDAE